MQSEMSFDGAVGRARLVVFFTVCLLALAGGPSACSDDGGGETCTDCGDTDRDRDAGGGDVVAQACSESSDCDAGFVCDTSADRCVPRCASDADCAPVEACDTGTGLCTPRAACSSQAECDSDEVCDDCLGVCVASTGGAFCVEDVNCPAFDQFCDSCIHECRQLLDFCEPCLEDRQCGTDADHCLDYAGGGRYCGVACGPALPACPIGATCSPEQGQCVPLTGSCLERTACEGDEDCLGIQICSAAGICVDGCANDGACPSSLVCSAGRCIEPCVGVDDCPEGTECADGHCRVPGGCTTSYDCPEPETYCDRSVGMCVAGCEVDADCFTATKECVDGACVERACRGAYACAFGQICDFDTGDCREPDEPHCETCDSSDINSCGAENVCLEVQDEDGNVLGDWCWVACSDDPLNVCPSGYACTELEVPTSGGGTEVRNVCFRRCDRNPV